MFLWLGAAALAVAFVALAVHARAYTRRVEARYPPHSRYVARGGPKPYAWEALVRAGYLRAIPLDPAGSRFELGPWSGDVRVADHSPLQAMPTEPPREPLP